MAFRIGKLVSMVSGGGSGLGRATVEHFVRSGGRVAILDLPDSKGQEVADNFGKDKCIFCPTDITNTEDVINACEATKEAFGRLQVLVNCAGIATARKIYSFQKNEPHDLDLFMKILNVNVCGTFNVMRHVVPLMSKNEGDEDGQRGVIINTSSIAAYDGQAGQAAYSASKGAIVSMTLPIARDLSVTGIRVATIAPGTFRTSLLTMLPQKVIDFLESQIPFPPRLGHPEEFASLVQSIVENKMLNGEVIRLDGALRMSH